MSVPLRMRMDDMGYFYFLMGVSRNCSSKNCALPDSNVQKLKTNCYAPIMAEEKAFIRRPQAEQAISQCGRRAGFIPAPTAIQQKSHSALAPGPVHDLLGVAQTGTGKTARFCIAFCS